MRAQIGTKRGCRMRENPYTQVRINKKNYRLLSCLFTGFACVCETAIIPNIELRERVCTPNNSTI